MRNPFTSSIAIGAGVAVGVILVIALVLVAMSNYGGDNGSTSANAQTSNEPGAKCPGDTPVPDPRPAKGKPVQVSPDCFVKGDVEVADSQTGTYASAHLSDDLGNLLYCADGCWIRSDFGANISNRTGASLLTEMVTTGCTGGCSVVHVWTFKDGKLVKLSDALKEDVLKGTGSAAATPSAAATAAPKAATAPVNCDPSIEKGKSMLVPKNCVVEGDVAVGTSESGPWTKLYDNDQTTGLVVVTKADVWVKAPYGASASGVSVSDAVSDVFDLGCGLDRGCYGGVDTVTVDVSNGQLVISHGGVKKPK